MHTALTHNDLEALAIRVDDDGRAWLTATDFAPHMLAVEALGGTGDVTRDLSAVQVEHGDPADTLQAWCSDLAGLSVAWRALGAVELAEWADDCLNDLAEWDIDCLDCLDDLDRETRNDA